MATQNNSTRDARTKQRFAWFRRWVPVWSMLATTLIVLLYLWLSPTKTAQQHTSSTFYEWFTSTAVKTFLQIGMTAITTVFVGTLARNNSQDQAQAAKKQSKEQARAAAEQSKEQSRHIRSSDLMAHQADAINHLGSHNKAIRAAGITEMVWVIRGRYTLARDSIKAGSPNAAEHWKDHAQELVDLAYKVNIDGETPNPTVVEARAKGLVALQKELADNPIKGLEHAFRKLSFEGAILPQSDLNKAQLQDADLQKTDLSRANLEEADLSRANLEEADLSRANLEGTDLSRANLSGTNLQEIDSLEGAFFKDAEYDDETRFPDGFDPDAMRMIYKP